MAGASDPVRVGVLGGVPAVLGGGGLEIQMSRTAAALRDLGHDVRPVQQADPEWAPDVLHVFGHTADVGHFLHHWRRHPARLVVSPVVVVPPARERRLLLATRLPIPAFEPRVLRALVERGDHLIALTDWEAELLGRIGGRRRAATSVIGNGADPGADRLGRDELRAATGFALPDRYAIVVGAVSRRKRQAEIAAELAGVMPLVVVGRWEGAERERERFGGLVRETGGAWLGEIADRRVVDGLIAEASAMVHLSEAEGQSLALLEALSLGTPCVVSDLPQQRELARRWPGGVRVLADGGDLPAALAELARGDGVVDAAVPTWAEVAKQVEAVYLGIAGPARCWDDRG